MHRLSPALTSASVILVAASLISAGDPQKHSGADAVTFVPTDWPWWRGPQRNGVADPSQKPPLKWSDTENIHWKSPVPGRGHGSPIVVGEQIFLATADEQAETQSVLCCQRQTGKPLWTTELHKGGFAKNGNAKSSHADSGCLSTFSITAPFTPRP